MTSTPAWILCNYLSCFMTTIFWSISWNKKDCIAFQRIGLTPTSVKKRWKYFLVSW